MKSLIILILTAFLNDIPDDQRLSCSIVCFAFSGVLLLAAAFMINEKILNNRNYKKDMKKSKKLFKNAMRSAK